MLGSSAVEGISVVIRQSFYHGSYAMIGEDLLPNSDFWVAVAHKQLIGLQVLSVYTSKDKPDTLRMYAHCARSPRGGIVLFAVNFSGDRRSFDLGPDLKKSPVDIYAFTPSDGGLTGRLVKLNGEELHLTPGGEVPALEPRRLPSPLTSLSVDAHGMTFWHFPRAKAGDEVKHACSSNF